VTPLAEGREISIGVVQGVVVAMSGSQNNTGLAGSAENVSPRLEPDPAPPAISPTSALRISSARHRPYGPPS
jgi:hypothetical protein